jgi:hypothetical protein
MVVISQQSYYSPSGLTLNGNAKNTMYTTNTTSISGYKLRECIYWLDNLSSGELLVQTTIGDNPTGLHVAIFY